MDQANRDVRVNMLWSCGYFTLLFFFSVLPSIPPAICLSPHCSLILQQMMQQQAALMAATQGSYLNPMAAIAAAQMQQMAAFNVNGLVATPMTPSSGKRHRQPGLSIRERSLHDVDPVINIFIAMKNYRLH